MSPVTSSVFEGEVVPIPTLPVFVIIILVPDTPSF